MPHTGKIWCTRKIIYLVISLVITVIMMINLFHLFATEIKTQIYFGIEVTFCQPRPEFAYFLEKIWSNILMLLYSLLPALILIILNVAIILKIQASLRFKRSTVVNQSNERDRRESRLTFMLICNSIFFIVMTLPFCIYYLLNSNFGDPNNLDAFEISNYKYAIVSLIGNLNHSGNFYLYVLTGSNVRNEIVQMFMCTRNICKTRNELYRKEDHGDSKASIANDSHTRESNVIEITSII